MSDATRWLTDLINEAGRWRDSVAAQLSPWLPVWWPLDPSSTTLALALVGIMTLPMARRLLRASRSRALPDSSDRPHSYDGSSTLRTPAPSSGTPRSELGAALGSCRSAFIATALFSGLINVLMLTGAIFMMEIYDRVLPSRSVPTLVGLALIAAVLFTVQGSLEFVRGRILSRIGASLDESLGARSFEALTRIPLKLGPKGESQQPIRDLDSIRSFLASNGPGALFDLPWLPLYLLVIFAFHPLLGTAATIGAIVLVTITVITELKTREPTRAANTYGARRSALADASRRNAEVIAAMGMGRRLTSEWQSANAEYLARQQRASDVAGGFGAVSKSLRFMLQSGMLGLGAWLVINGQATAGIIIAGSILLGRALAPVDSVIANSKNFIAARQSWARLSKLLEAIPASTDPLPLHAPRERLTVTNVTLPPPGGQVAVVLDVSFEMTAGHAVGIIGPSGSGKSCLARALVGAWQPARGKVQLDGASLNQWSEEALGSHIGYLPQDVELFSGTIARNIARFDPEATADAVIAAAKAAGVHDLITSFPEGYETQIGENGAALSAGQRQRVALARALYGEPFLVVLDEPNSNLDSEGEQALLAAIEGVKARRGIVVVVAHRANVLEVVDYIIAMQSGRARPPVPKAQIYGKLQEAAKSGAVAGGKGRPRITALDPSLAAKLKEAMESGREPDATFTVPAEPGDEGQSGSEKPRIRLATANAAAAATAKPTESKP